MRKSLFLLLTFCCVGITFGQTKVEQVMETGEVDPGLYYGPLNPEFQHHKSSGSVRFSDDTYLENFISKEVEPQAISLTNFWFDDFINEANCPNELLSENVDYIQYLFRLQTLSYLVEAIKEYRTKILEFGGKSQDCSVGYKDLFKGCSAQTNEMKKFVERVQFRYDKTLNLESYQRYNQSQFTKWVIGLDRGGETSDISQIRIKQYCDKKDCGILTSSSAREILKNVCIEDKKLLKDICSEKDSLMGASYVNELSYLISNSAAFVNINKFANGSYCLERFVKTTKIKERYYPQLSAIFPKVYQLISERKEIYPQGKFFIPGALKEFDDKGLTSFLFVPEPKPEPQPEAIPEPTPEPKKVIKVTKVEPGPKPIPKVIPKPVPQPAPKPVVLSAFEKALKKIIVKGEDYSDIDMKDFADDFKFSDSLREALAGPLRDYQTRSGLSDMKIHDNLGSKDEPISLIFLKYMIDFNNHQGLYNVQSVIGKEFYIVNDIDEKDTAVWASINFDDAQNDWQLTLISEKYKQKKIDAEQLRKKKEKEREEERKKELARKKKIELIKKLKLQKKIQLPDQDLE